MIKIKQIDIAKKTGVTPSMINMVFSGKRRPSWKLANRLADIFGTSPSFWMEADTDAIKEIVNNGGQR
jgi:transcriptional regulator with XRE-family HTH domain